MTSQTRYRVVREHIGDKSYAEGDERIALASDVAHLVPRVLEPLGPAKSTAAPKVSSDAPEPDETGPEAKAETPAQNKAEGAAPANKASTGRKA